MKHYYKRKSVRMIVWFLKTIGVDIHQTSIPFSKYYQFIGVFPVFCSLFSISLYIFQNRKQIHVAIIAAAYIGATVVMNSAIFIFLKNRQKLLKILEMIDNDLYRYPDEKNIVVNINGILDEKNSTKILAFILWYECFGFSLSAISPFIGFLITGVYETSMYPSSYPWEKEGFISLLVVNILQSTGTISAFWICYVIQMLMASLTIEFLRQYQRLGVALSTISERTENKIFKITRIKNRMDSMSVNNTNPYFKEKFKNIYDEVYGQNIKHCIRHHQQLWKLFHLFEPWFSVFFSIELAISAATFALVFYNLLTAWSPETFLTIIGSTFNVTANFFSRCLLGEIFTEMNEKIRRIILHEVNWYEQSPRNNNLLKFFHLSCRRSFNLVGLSIYSASYFTFSQLLRMSYSFFNIIHSSFSNK